MNSSNAPESLLTRTQTHAHHRESPLPSAHPSRSQHQRPRLQSCTCISAPLLMLLLPSCTNNAAYIYETQKVALAVESRPDPSQPISGTLGIKQRVAAIVPSQGADTGAGATSGSPSHDAVSVISSFTFDKRPAQSLFALGPVDLRAGLITGRAARSLISQPGSSPNSSRAADATLAITPAPIHIQPIANTLAQALSRANLTPAEYDELSTLVSHPFSALTTAEKLRIESLLGLTGQLRTPDEASNQSLFLQLRAALATHPHPPVTNPTPHPTAAP